MNKLSKYILTADLFRYPDKVFQDLVCNVQYYLDESCPEAAKELKDFTLYVVNTPLNEMEELYTRSFDVQAITTLDLGYILFGDDYKRGELLVNLNREHKEAGNDCHTELADHLPNVLRLIGVIKNKKLVDELIQKIIAPGIKKMIKEFEPETIKTKKKIYQKHHKTIIEESEKYATIYQKALKAVYILLNNDFNLKEEVDKEINSDFLQSVNTEIEVEHHHE